MNSVFQSEPPNAQLVTSSLGIGYKAQQLALRRKDVNTALILAGRLVFIRLVAARGYIQSALTIHLQSVGTTAVLPIEDQFSAVGNDRSIRPQREAPEFAGSADVVVVIVGDVQVLVSGETNNPLARSTSWPMTRETLPGASIR